MALPAHAAINANKAFSPDVVTASQPSTVTIFFLNANNNPAGNLAFTDVLPAGVVVAPTPNVNSTCGGSLTANAGDSQVAFSNGTIPANAGLTPGSCQVTFNVVAAAAGVYINTIAAGDVTSTEGANSQPAEATLNVSTLTPLSGTKVFAPANVHGNGNPSTVTITLNNPNGIALTNLSFVDALPASIVVAPAPNASTTCGGTLTANAGAANVSLAGGTIAAGGSCTVAFAIVAANPNAAQNGNVTNTLPAGTITTFEGVTNPLITSNNLLVQTGAQLVKAFSPASIVSGGTSTLTVTVRNYNASAIAPLAFTDALPAGMTIAAPLATGGTCVSGSGASFSVAVAGGTSFTTSGGSLAGVAANAGNTFTSCTFTINVTANNANTAPATFTNNIPTGNFGGVAYAQSNNAVLTVTAPSSLGGSKAFSLPVAPAGAAYVQTRWFLATVTITNAAASPVDNFALTDALSTMGAGYTFGSQVAATSSCGGAFNAPGTATVSFSGGTIPASGNCVLTFPVNVAPNAATGNRTNTIPAGNVTGTIGGSAVTNTAPLTAVANVAAALGLSKAFAPATVLAGGDSRLTITVTRNAGAVPFTGLALTDTLPAGHLVSSNPNLVSSCGGTVTATPGTGSIQLANGALAATSCSIAVNVTTPAGAGSSVNSIPANSVSTNEAVTNASAANATLNRVTGIVSLAKSFDPATVALNSTSTMRVRVLNNQTGAVALSGVALTDSLPAGMVIHSTPGGSWSGTGCTGGSGITAPAGGTTVSITGKSIAAGAICTIQVTVRAAAAGNLINELDASALVSAQGITNVDPVAATLSSTGVADLSVTKTNGLTQIVAGTSVVYTVVVGNAAGGADVVGATFTDAVPPGMTFTSWTCTPSGTGTCTAAGSGPISDTVGIPAGQSLTYSITMAVPASATGPTITNTATITPPASVIDTNPANNTAQDVDPVVQNIALGISKTDNSLTYTPGGVGTYAIVVTNSGPSNASNLNFADNLPAGVTIRAPGVSCTPAGTASCGSAGANAIGTAAVSYTAMTIAAGAGNQVTISVPVAYAPGMTTNPLVNTASVQRGTETPVTANDSSTRAPDIVLDVDKDDGTTTYQPGTNGTYTIVVANDGLTTAGNVSLADTLPAGVTVRAPGVTCAPTAGSDCGTVTGAAGDGVLGTAGAIILPAGELAFTVPVVFGAGMTAASITNTAIATATDPELPPPGTVTAQDDDTNTLVLPDLTIAKSHSGNFFRGQVGAQFSIVVSNVGAAPTVGTVTVTDTLPAGLTATAIGGTGWSCTLATLTCTRSDALAPAGAWPAITLTVDVAANATSPLVNVVVVSGGGETNTSNNTAQDSVTVDGAPDPTIVKSHSGNFFRGQVGASFTITVQNVGDTATSGTVTVTDTLPAGLTATAISGSGWSCTQPAGPCTRSDALAPSASWPVLTLTVDVAVDAGSPLVNLVTVSGGSDGNPDNNTATDAVTVGAGIDLTIAKSHGGAFVRGGSGTFTIIVSNVGGQPSSGTITVTDTLPAGLTATSIGGSGWTCGQPIGPCTHDGPLAPAASLPALTLTVAVATNAVSPLVNVTTVAGGGDSNPANNTATDTVVVVSPPSNDPTAVPVHTPAGFALMAALLALLGAAFARRRARR